MQLAEGTKFLVLAPLVKERKGEHRDVIEQVRKAGLHPRARRRHRALARGRPIQPRQEEEAHDRRGGRPPGREARARLSASPTRSRPRSRSGEGTVVVAAEGQHGPGPLRAPRLPPLRDLLPGADAAAVLLQLAPGHVPRVLRPRHAHGDGPRARGARTPSSRSTRAPSSRSGRSARRPPGAATSCARSRASAGSTSTSPWKALSEAQRRVILFGTGDERVSIKLKQLVGLGRLQDALRGRHQLDDAPHARDEVGGDAAVLPEVPLLAALLRLRRPPHPRRGARREDRRDARSRRSRRSRSPTPSPSSTRSRSREPRRRSRRSCSRRSARGCASCSTWASTT